MARLTEQQLAWAKQHDWCLRVSWEGFVVVRDWNAAGVLELRTIKDFKELRAWAGY